MNQKYNLKKIIDILKEAKYGKFVLKNNSKFSN